MAFVLLRNSWFSFNCYTQREATPTQKSAQKWRCNFLRERLQRAFTHANQLHWTAQSPMVKKILYSNRISLLMYKNLYGLSFTFFAICLCLFLCIHAYVTQPFRKRKYHFKGIILYSLRYNISNTETINKRYFYQVWKWWYLCLSFKK